MRSRMLDGFNDLNEAQLSRVRPELSGIGTSAQIAGKLSDRADTARASAASATRRRSRMRQSPPDRRRRESRASPSRDPNSRSAASSSNVRAVQLVQHRRDLDAEPHRPQRRAIGHDHEHALAFLARVLARRRREAHGIEADAGNARARSARRRAPARRSTARRSARTACRCRGRPRCSSSRSRRCLDRASPESGCACSATG